MDPSEAKTPVKRAAIYTRVSTQKQVEEGFSLEAQDQRARALIDDREGWKLAPECVYEEPGVSGKLSRRPALDRMLADAEAGRFEVLVVWAYNRLGRSTLHTLRNIERLEAAGVEVVSMTEPIDATTPMGRTMRTMAASFAQLENEQRAANVSLGARARAEQGLPPGGRFRRYGYRREDSGRMRGRRRVTQLVVVPAEAEVVQRMYRESLEGRSQHAITVRLNNDGIRTSDGKTWTQATVGRMLRDPFYRGAVAYKGEVVCEEGEHEAIIERGLWGDVQNKLAERDKAPGAPRGRRTKGAHLFTDGLLRCRCGYALVPRYRKEASDVYICRGRVENGLDFCDQRPIPRDPIDQAAYGYFEGMGLDVERTRREWEEAVQLRQAETRRAREQAERELTRLRTQHAHVTKEFRSGGLSGARYEENMTDIEAEIAAQKAEVERLRNREQERADEARLDDAEEEVLHYLAHLRAVIAGDVRDAEGTGAARAAMLRLFERFEIHDQPEYDWRFAPEPGVYEPWIPGRAERQPPPLPPESPAHFVAGGRTVRGQMLWIVAVVRPHVIEGIDGGGLVPVLRPTGLPAPDQASVRQGRDTARDLTQSG